MFLTNLHLSRYNTPICYHSDWVIIQTREYIEDVYEIKDKYLKENFSAKDIVVCCTLFSQEEKQKRYHKYFSTVQDYIGFLGEITKDLSPDTRNKFFNDASKALNTQMKLARELYPNEQRWLSSLTICWNLRIKETEVKNMPNQNTVEALKNMNIGEEYHYANRMTSGTEKDREICYKRLNHLKENAVETQHEFSGDYSKFTFILEDGSRFEYLENDDLGIPHSLKRLENVNELERDDDFARV